MKETIRIRYSDNVLDEEDWTVVELTLKPAQKRGKHTDVKVVKWWVLHHGAYSPVNMIGWDIQQLLDIQNEDPTGYHPETYTDIWNGEKWTGFLNEEELRTLLGRPNCCCAPWDPYYEHCKVCRPEGLSIPECTSCGTTHGMERDCRQEDVDDCVPGYMRSDRYQL
jgi:hypothetical protein